MGNHARKSKQRVEIHTENSLIEVPDDENLFLQRTCIATLTESLGIPKLAEEDI
jgi:hypothetical protein